jgi:hypothetical protein
MSDVVLVGSDRCGLDDLFLDYGTGAERGRLGLGTGWPRRCTAFWRTSGGDVACAVRDLGEVPVAGCVPARRFTWRQRQRHRPGLQFMVSTGRLHGFESLEERSLLLALDFTGSVDEFLSQPFRLKFETASGDSGEHIPDFLAVFRDGSRWLLDVQPAGLVKGEDAARFPAVGEAALDWGRGDERWRTFRWLEHHRDCQAVQAAAGDAAGPSRPRQPVTLDDLTDYQRANRANNRRPPPIDNRTRYRSARATWRWCP